MHRSCNILQPVQASRLGWKDKWRRYIRTLDNSKASHAQTGWTVGLVLDIVLTIESCFSMPVKVYQ